MNTEKKHVDFIEYGKRFLGQGTTDYRVLEHSNVFMLQGIEARNNPLIFLKANGLDIRDNAAFNNSVGKVSALLLQFNGEFGGLQRPYLFAQIQSRQENEVDGGSGKMSRNFLQIRITLLDRNNIINKARFGIYSSILISSTKRLSKLAWEDFSLTDYQGDIKAQPIGEKQIQLRKIWQKQSVEDLDANVLVEEYFPFLKDVYDKDISDLIDKFLSYHRASSLNPDARSVYAVVGERAGTLPQGLMFLYKVLLIQDLQAYTGWYFKDVTTFGLDDLTQRGTKVNFFAPFDLMPSKTSLCKLLKIIGLDRLYSPVMELISTANQAASMLEMLKLLIVVDIPDTNLLAEFRMDDSERIEYIQKYFNFLLHAYPQKVEEKGFLLYVALDNLFDTSKRYEWIRDFAKKEPGSLNPLMSYLNFHAYYDKLFLVLSELNNDLIPNKIQSLIEKLFQKAVGEYKSWEDLMMFVGEVRGLNLERLLSIFEDWQIVKGDEGFTCYILNGLIDNNLPIFVSDYYADKIIVNKDFRKKLIDDNGCKVLPNRKFFYFVNVLSSKRATELPENEKKSFYTEMLDGTLKTAINAVGLDPKSVVKAWEEIIKIGKDIYKDDFCTIDFVGTNVNLDPIHEAFVGAASNKELFEHAHFWFREILALLKVKKNNQFEKKYKELSEAYSNNDILLSSSDTSSAYLLSRGKYPSGASLSLLDKPFLAHKNYFINLWASEPEKYTWAVPDVETLAVAYRDNDKAIDTTNLKRITAILADKHLDTKKFNPKIMKDWAEKIPDKKNWEKLLDLFRETKDAVFADFILEIEGKLHSLMLDATEVTHVNVSSQLVGLSENAISKLVHEKLHLP